MSEFSFCAVVLPCSNENPLLAPIHSEYSHFCYFLCWMSISSPRHSAVKYKSLGCHIVEGNNFQREIISCSDQFKDSHSTNFTVEPKIIHIASDERRIASLHLHSYHRSSMEKCWLFFLLVFCSPKCNCSPVEDPLCIHPTYNHSEQDWRNYQPRFQCICVKLTKGVSRIW